MNSVTTSTINATAKACAMMLRDNGWQGPGHGYNLGSFHGDVESLSDVLGRDPTQDELEDFEHEIRTLLTYTA